MTSRTRSTVFTVALFLAMPLVSACDQGRFPICKDNEECAKDTEGKARVCYNLKCVECRYDSDCAPGKACSAAKNVCEGIDERAAQPPPPLFPTATEAKWEPGTWDDCAKACKDPVCIRSCDAKFPKAASSAAAEEPKAPKKPGAK
jgi:hypothetical protein